MICCVLWSLCLIWLSGGFVCWCCLMRLRRLYVFVNFCLCRKCWCFWCVKKWVSLLRVLFFLRVWKCCFVLCCLVCIWCWCRLNLKRRLSVISLCSIMVVLNWKWFLRWLRRLIRCVVLSCWFWNCCKMENVME